MGAGCNLHCRPRHIPEITQKLQSKRTVAKLRPSAQSQIRLIWVCRKNESYSKLSFNIIREVSLYLLIGPRILLQRGPDIYQFHASTLTFQPFFPIPRLSTIGYMQNSLFINENRVFLTLKTEDLLLFVMYFVNSFTILGSYKGRSHCGVIFNGKNDCIYAFGGELYMKQSEKVHNSSLETHLLPNMLVGKAKLGLCLHNNLIYLCGGTKFSIETFNSDSEKFDFYAVFGWEFRNIGQVCAVSVKNRLILVGNEAIWEEIAGKWIKKRENNANRVKFGSNPVIFENSLLFSGENCILSMEIDTLQEEKYEISL